MSMAWIILLAIEPAFCDCIQLAGEEIHASDLAAVIVAFKAAKPETILGLAPAPGVRRVFSRRDLTFAAHLAGIADADLPAAGVCFERLVHQITEQELTRAMSEAFAGTSVQIIIVDHSSYGVPPGRLVFQLAGLSSPPPAQPDAAVFWHGRVRYGETRSMEIWAKVRITATTRACVAATDIQPGKPIEADQVHFVDIARFPLLRAGGIKDFDGVAGRVVRRPIRAGEEIVAKELEYAREIGPGDTVHVLAVSGNARVTLDAVATSGGRKGDTIVLKNPGTNTSFRAVVDGRDRAVVHTGKGDGL